MKDRRGVGAQTMYRFDALQKNVIKNKQNEFLAVFIRRFNICLFIHEKYLSFIAMKVVTR